MKNIILPFFQSLRDAFLLEFKRLRDYNIRIEPLVLVTPQLYREIAWVYSVSSQIVLFTLMQNKHVSLSCIFHWSNAHKGIGNWTLWASSFNQQNVNVSIFLVHRRIKIQKHYFEIPESAIKVKCARRTMRNSIILQSDIQH